MKFPMEVYNPQGAHKVVFGPEEYAAARAEGWADERPEAARRSASGPPSVYKSEVAAASESQDSTESTESYEATAALLEQRLSMMPIASPEPKRREPKPRSRPPKVQSIGEVA